MRKPLKYRGDSNMAALGVVGVMVEDSHESLIFMDAVACEIISKWMHGCNERKYGYFVWYMYAQQHFQAK